MKVILAASAVVIDDMDRILLVQRVHEPEAGCWTIPGGKVEAGETLQQTAARETREETGINVTIGDELWSLRISAPEGGIYEIHDFAATYDSGVVTAGDDAADANWFTWAELAELQLTDDLLGYLTRAGLYRGGMREQTIRAHNADGKGGSSACSI